MVHRKQQHGTIISNFTYTTCHWHLFCLICHLHCFIFMNVKISKHNLVSPGLANQWVVWGYTVQK